MLLYPICFVEIRPLKIQPPVKLFTSRGNWKIETSEQPFRPPSNCDNFSCSRQLKFSTEKGHGDTFIHIKKNRYHKFAIIGHLGNTEPQQKFSYIRRIVFKEQAIGEGSGIERTWVYHAKNQSQSF